VPIDAARLLRRAFPEIRREYDARDTVVYALAIGLGRNATGRDRCFVDRSCLVAFPTMAASLGTPGFWMRDVTTGIDALRALHVGQAVTLHRPLPAAAGILATHRVTSVVDKGAPRGALVVVRREIFDARSGATLATVDAQTLCRADGGCGDAGEALPAPHRIPDRPPDAVRDVATFPDAAVLFALGGDDNPLHRDMETAQRAGYDRPILHGVCTLGIAATALAEATIGNDVARLRSVAARFTGHVYPGETIRVELWRDADTVSFRGSVVGRGSRVLDAGHALIA